MFFILKITFFRLLYWVWNEKANLLKRGMELNPFSSEHFYWIDVGCLRPANIIPQLKNLFWLKKRKIIF
jgi:hypothetical protein